MTILTPYLRAGIRVNGVAPGLIRTPLWTDHPEIMTLVDFSKDEWATAEEVAEGMHRRSRLGWWSDIGDWGWANEVGGGGE
jgi:NAD(P)-dependent dehydrogenase (short-subunit alcohol dehydrogenase family)